MSVVRAAGRAHQPAPPDSPAHHRLGRIRRQFDRDERLSRILHVCRPCHSHIYAVLGEKELAETYNHRDALFEHPEIARFVAWIADKPAGFRPRIRTPKD